MRVINIREHLAALSAPLRENLNSRIEQQRDSAYAGLLGNLEAELTPSGKGLSELCKILQWRYIQNDRAASKLRSLNRFFSGKESRESQHTLICESVSKAVDTTLSEAQQKDLTYFDTDQAELASAAHYIRIWNALNQSSVAHVLEQLEALRSGETKVTEIKLVLILKKLAETIIKVDVKARGDAVERTKHINPNGKLQQAHQLISEAIQRHPTLLRLYEYHNTKIEVAELAKRLAEYPKEATELELELTADAEAAIAATMGPNCQAMRPLSSESKYIDMEAEAHRVALQQGTNKMNKLVDTVAYREAQRKLKKMLEKHPGIEAEAANTLNATHSSKYNLSDPQNQMAMLHHHHPGEYEDVLAKIAKLFKHQAPAPRRTPTAADVGASAKPATP